MPEQSNPTGAVFISYGSQDAQAAGRISEALRAAGIEVWLDQSTLRAGDAWDEQIKKQIHDCALFIPVISAHTNARTEGYFRREWNLATRRLLDMAQDAPFLVPVVIDESREAEARVPEEFLRAQWIWLPGGETPPTFAQRVRQLLGGGNATEHAMHSTVAVKFAPRAQGVVSVQPGGSTRVWRVGLALIALLLVLSGVVFWYFQASGDAPATQPVPAPASPVTTAAPNEKSIAVLPFVNMSSDKEQEYFADGISEELLNLLVQVPELRVIARTSSFAFKGQNIEVADIAKKLNVAHVLEGSVRKAGNKIRITAQLVRTSDSSHLWSQTYDRQLTDVFAIQDQIAASVVAELKTKLLGAASKAKITDPNAYALFLQAREIGRQNTKAGLEKSNNLYRQVLALDAGYVAAWEGLASNHLNQAFFGLIPVDEGIRLAREATNKALALEPARATSLLWLSYIASHYDLDLPAAAQHLGAALALEPTNPDVLAEAGALMRRLTRLDEAIAIGEYQVGLDPVNLFGYEILGTAYQYAGRLDDALAAWRTILNLSPYYVGAHEGAGEMLLAKGDTQAALSEMQQEVLPAFRLVGLSMAYHALGKGKESDAALMESIQKHSREYPFMIAYAYAYRGEADRAFEWLHKAVEYHDLLFVAVAGHPMLMKIHSDPRWLLFLRKHGMAPEQLAAIKFEVEVPN
jgi:TolB-like protein/tetratricopeptide (TPR) repeat protein